MHLVKRITSALTKSSGLSLTESQIKSHTNQPKIDYGTMNNTLRRLCRHGVLRRTVGISSSTGVPSWHYKINMNSDAIQEYIKRQEAKMQKHRSNRSYFHFGDHSHTITKSVNDELSPLVIGDGIAPNGLELRCLLVHGGYDMEVSEHRGYKVLTFKRK